MSNSIIVLGDICPEWGFPDAFKTGKTEKVFHDILPILNDADYVVANLESPATQSKHKANKNSIHLKANPSDISVLKESGIDAFALANNHILDYGTQGLQDTLSNLRQLGICYYGAGDSINASKPHFAVIGTWKIGFIAFAEREFNCAIDYDSGANVWDDIDSLNAIRETKKQCDFLIVQYHGGIEHYKYPSPYLQKKCRAMAESGADFVTCQHSHCIGTRENWNGCEILYGQGNTIFGYDESLGDMWNKGLICRLEIDNDTNRMNVYYIPVIATADGEHLADQSACASILEELESDSGRITDMDFVTERWKEFCLGQASSYLPMLFGWRINLIRINKVLKGRLLNWVIGPVQRRNAMNLIRCDAHREVVSTLLSLDYSRNNTRSSS